MSDASWATSASSREPAWQAESPRMHHPYKLLEASLSSMYGFGPWMLLQSWPVQAHTAISVAAGWKPLSGHPEHTRSTPWSPSRFRNKQRLQAASTNVASDFDVLSRRQGDRSCFQSCAAAIAR